MAYFACGTQGADYQEQYCRRCIHGDDDPGCPVWDLHLAYNGEEDVRGVLEALIPIDEAGLWPGQCRMFVERRP